jgi:hypothetical protein
MDASNAWVMIAVMLSNSIQWDRLVNSGNFDTWDRHLLSQKTIPVFFYPSQEPPPAASVIASLKLTRCAAGPSHHVDDCTQYSTALGNHVLVCATPLEVPAIYGDSLASARNTSFSTFCGKRTTGEYVVANKWITWPMLHHPLTARFDFWAKVDVDVCFREQLDLARTLVARPNLYFYHTMTTKDNALCDARHSSHIATPCHPTPAVLLSTVCTKGPPIDHDDDAGALCLCAAAAMRLSPTLRPSSRRSSHAVRR